MALHRIGAIARQELIILRNDLAPVVVLVGMPLVVMSFIRSTFGYALRAEGFPSANGSEQAVPGMAVMFGFFAVTFVAYAFLREHDWGTWPRLVAGPTSIAEVIIGKAVIPFVVMVLQAVVLFVGGGALFDLHVSGDPVAIAVVAVGYAACLVALGIALVSVSTTVQQVDTLTNLGALAFAGIGGALAPLAALPSWARGIAPGTPTYWAMRGYRAVILDGDGVGGVVVPVLVLFAFALGFLGVVLLCFRAGDVKKAWA